jgi:multiple antibiotic resistance protein
MLAAVQLTENARYSLVQQGFTALMMLAVLVVVLLLMLLEAPIHRLVGDSGASVISKVMGLVLSSVATASTLSGIEEYFGL